MRVMLVTMDYPPPMGGIQIVTKNLEDDLIAAGHDVYVVNFDGRNTSNYKKLSLSDLFASSATRNDYFHIGNLLNPLRLLRPTGYRDFVYHNLIYRVTNEARKYFRPDITHILKPTLASAVYECPEPFVVTCHGEEVQDTPLVRYSLLRARAIHCVSHYSERLVNNLVGDEHPPVMVIHNSVDLALFGEPPQEKDRVIITSCRLVERKNVDSVIRALALLPSTILKEYQYIVVGDGPELQQLTVQARKLDHHMVHFAGQVSEHTKLQWLCRAKLFVLCPKPFVGAFEANEEGFGISYLEAQAAGMPVIGSNRGGIPEAVGDGGLLVDDPTDSQEIAAKIRLVLEDPNLYEKLRQNALAHVRHFDRKSKIKDFERLYQEALMIAKDRL